MLKTTGEALLQILNSTVGYRIFVKVCSCTRTHDLKPDLASLSSMTNFGSKPCFKSSKVQLQHNYFFLLLSLVKPVFREYEHRRKPLLFASMTMAANLFLEEYCRSPAKIRQIIQYFCY